MLYRSLISSKKKIRLSPNQEKVIKDKYLRDSASVEEWLTAVAHNIALSEILCNANAEKWGVYNGVQKMEHGANRNGVYIGRMMLFHEGLHESSQRDANFLKLMANLETVYKNVPDAKQIVDFWQEEFYGLMYSFDFLPNSPTLMNAGRELQQLSACYVLPVPDSIEGITKSLSAQSLIQKSGGGTGFSFGRIRPKGDIVKKTKGVASGALSFMQIFDKMTDVVKQGGARRGANMGILPYWHPEIKEFITMKSSSNCMENFNVSVAVDDKFMGAVESGEDYDLVNPHTGKVVGKLNAREVFNSIVDCAWKTGDPGVIFLDRINNSPSNPTPAFGEIESTNPCGEQPLLPWEPCNLGSVNLSHFVKGELGKGEIDYEALGKTVSNAVRFLDNVIEINNYPLAEIEKMAKGNRRIGLGVMGWAECLAMLGVGYDTDAAIKQAEELMGFINTKALETSEELAKERGLFPNWKGSIYDPASQHYRGAQKMPRNCARTTIAPTGTIAITAGLQGSGIEPFFGIVYTRYNARALETLKNNQTPDAKDTFFEVNPLFKEIAEENNYFGLKQEDLWKKIDKNHKSVKGIAQIPEKVQKLFPTAHDINVETHIKMQAAFQKHTDNGVSKTINMSNSATTEDVKKAYLLAYAAGCKGTTVYRDGCKSQQVLNLGAPSIKAARARKPFGVSSQYYQINTGYGPLHIHINYDEQGPYQVFTNIPPLGTEISGLTSLVGILLSKYLENGGDPIRVLKHLNCVKGDRPIGLGENRINSIPHAIAVAFRNHLRKNGDIESLSDVETDRLELWEEAKALYCPKCYSSNVSYQSGCSGPTCHDCGHSECS
ncbi:MAG: adenosylcobalamin-dependent ribonucleoside-diphosphate reductase [Elusimicrobia bacterium]|nr:adenosylcobalamin-dependent ribonucleoside-diphosphate reductase [Elusimicrobiota bacterium]